MFEELALFEELKKTSRQKEEKSNLEHQRFEERFIYFENWRIQHRHTNIIYRKRVVEVLETYCLYSIKTKHNTKYQ